MSPRSADTPKLTGKTTTTAPIPGPGGTHPEPIGHRNHRAARDRILTVFICILELTCAIALQNPIPPGEIWSPRSANTPKITGSQTQRRDKLKSETARPANIRDNQMARGKCKNISNRNQGYLA